MASSSFDALEKEESDNVDLLIDTEAPQPAQPQVKPLLSRHAYQQERADYGACPPPPCLTRTCSVMLSFAFTRHARPDLGTAAVRLFVNVQQGPTNLLSQIENLLQLPTISQLPTLPETEEQARAARREVIRIDDRVET